MLLKWLERITWKVCLELLVIVYVVDLVVDYSNDCLACYDLEERPVD